MKTIHKKRSYKKWVIDNIKNTLQKQRLIFDNYKK